MTPEEKEDTMGQNEKKRQKNNRLVIYFPTSEGVSEMSERANLGASGPVLQSGFLVVLAHSVMATGRWLGG